MSFGLSRGKELDSGEYGYVTADLPLLYSRMWASDARATIAYAVARSAWQAEGSTDRTVAATPR